MGASEDIDKVVRSSKMSLGAIVTLLIAACYGSWKAALELVAIKQQRIEMKYALDRSVSERDIENWAQELQDANPNFKISRFHRHDSGR